MGGQKQPHGVTTVVGGALMHPGPSELNENITPRAAAPRPSARATHQLAGALGQVNLGLLAADVGVAATNTLDGRQRVHDLALALNVRVHHTEDVLEVLWEHQRPANKEKRTKERRKRKENEKRKKGKGKRTEEKKRRSNKGTRTKGQRCGKAWTDMRNEWRLHGG